MAEEQSEYLLGATDDEVRRLTIQQSIIKHGMGGKLILAPVDLSQSNLAILDSACADGLWLRDVSSQLKTPYKLVGADLMPQFFPKSTPPELKLIQHDFTNPWPAELHNSFDLVHQRLALAGARSASVEDSVKMLPTLLKPGGWVQLGELDLTEDPVDGDAAKALYRTMRTLFEKGESGNAHSCPGTMAGWLKEAGLIDVREEIVRIPVGKRVKDGEMAKISAAHMIHVATMIPEVTKKIGGEVPVEDVDLLSQTYPEELEKIGSEFRFIIAMGQKPN
ncbi:hypothetical protein NA57DRAFT_47434 [Rhizodiscina lignyota]|uniref:Methyltransferase n=1 Tax=Rhizodiscina lignyota TaxID=1504668 RepID=A0A9P4I7P6_9PEZI|nr:hypothetical protein NA57DRAFT_47434 [Rhizodiscina lignyota]